jgi:hypothetical protein
MHFRNSCVLHAISFPLTDLDPGPRKRNTPALENIKMLVESAPRTPLGHDLVGADMENEAREPGNKQAEPGSTSEDEDRKIRRLQIMMNMVMSVISQDTDLTVEEASELVANSKRAALAMFPDKELAYDIIYKPRLQRLMNERFRLQ